MVVDSSVWIEILRAGPLAKRCEKAISGRDLSVPTVVLFEVYRKLKSSVSEDFALEALASISQNKILNLDREVAVLAADLSLMHGLPMADSLVLAHAEHLREKLLTLDHDFASIPNVDLIRGS